MTALSILSTGPKIGAPAPMTRFREGIVRLRASASRARFSIRIGAAKNDPTSQSLMTWIMAAEFTLAGPCPRATSSRFAWYRTDGGIVVQIPPKEMRVATVGESRPSWVPADLYPFASHFEDINGSRVHYLDEGAGPPLILLHGNPTWSFLYRDVIAGLRDRHRCIAVDYPGFGLSHAAPGYGYTPADHAQVVEDLILRLDLRGATLMVQDWGGPIGFAAATRHPDRFSGFVIGNTWAWPKSDLGTQVFSRLLGGPIGGWLILQRNFFVERIIPAGVRRTKLPEAVMNAYRGPFPTPESRRPVHVFPREILA